MVASLLALFLAQAQTISVYVGPQARDGFVDTDAGVVDSIADIRGQLRGTGVRVVSSEGDATIKLYVLSRERFASGSSFNTGTGAAVAPGVATGSGVSVGIDGMRVRARLKVGTYGTGAGRRRVQLQEGGAGRREGRSDLDRGESLPAGHEVNGYRT